MLTHKHPFLNSSGRRLAVMCFALFLKKGKFKDKLANRRGWQFLY